MKAQFLCLAHSWCLKSALGFVLMLCPLTGVSATSLLKFGLLKGQIRLSSGFKLSSGKKAGH